MKIINEAEAVKLLQKDAVGIMPTDTLLGVVCRATSELSVERIFQAKQRESKPGTVIAASIQQLVDLGLQRHYLEAIESYWPNPISVIIPCTKTELAYLHLGKQSLAVRVPSNSVLRAILEHTGPLLTSSANLTQQPPARNLLEAIDYFGEGIDFYADTSVAMLSKPSTILKIVDDTVVVLRQGAVTIDGTAGAVKV